MEGKKKWTFDSKKLNINELKKIIKSISLDKWFLIGAAGLVLVLCSDSCQGDNGGSTDSTDNGNTGSLYNSLYSDTGSSSDDSESAGYDSAGYESYMSDLDRYTAALEEKLENILMSVEGAGKVQVMITLKNTSTKEVLMEEPYSRSNVTEEDGDGGSRDTDEISQDYHVIYSEGSDGTTIPFVISENSPQVEGVAVVAQGGDSALVKEKITGIIKALFGIEINKIAVGKMK